MNPIKTFKEEQKARASEIRELKSHRPLSNRGDYDINDLDEMIRNLSWDFRHHHIAGCEVRGRKRSEIEKPAENNKPNDNWINAIKSQLINELEEWRNEREKDVRACAL